MLKEIGEEDMQPFFQLMGDLEVGRHFEPDNKQHIQWLWDKIRRNYGRGVRFFAFCEDDGTPRGIISLLVDDFLTFRLGYITHLGVFKEFRGSGYGSRLLSFAVEQARQEHCYCVYLDTYSGNPRNVEFYAKNGFIPAAVIPHANGPGDHGQLWFAKVLAA